MYCTRWGYGWWRRRRRRSGGKAVYFITVEIIVDSWLGQRV